MELGGRVRDGEQWKEPKRNSTKKWCRQQDTNSGHIGVNCATLPLQSMNLPGQALVSQVLVSLLLPTQSLPPKAGRGLVHDRTRCCVPVPHVLEHGSQSRHSLHSPSTARISEHNFRCRLGLRSSKMSCVSRHTYNGKVLDIA